MTGSRWAAGVRRQGRLAARLAVVVPLGLVGASVLGGSASAALPSGCAQSGSTVTCTFSYTGGAQTFTVPAGVTSVTVTADGAAGGDAQGFAVGGMGAQVTGTLQVTPGGTLQVNVGGQGGDGFCSAGEGEAGGWNGGGNAGTDDCGGALIVAGGGGGASDVRDGSFALTDRLLVAGGGGGGAGDGLAPLGSGGAGGSGGGSNSDGTSGTSVTSATGGGKGLAGSQSSSGGTGGTAGSPGGKSGGNGGLGTGGNGGGTNSPAGDGGGGGGGYYGGGAGGSGGQNGDSNPAAGGGGGGGGSDYTGTATNVTVTDGVQSGNGQVIISYIVDADLAIATHANINVDATGPSGATVKYTAPAVTDPDDSTSPAAVCTPKPGSVFPIGTTTVTCTATDTDDTDSPVSTTFTITVKGAVAQLGDLYQAALSTRGGKALAQTVALAERQAAGRHPMLACQTLNLFILEVQLETPWRIPAGTAAQLIAAARQIEAVLGCSSHRPFFPFGF